VANGFDEDASADNLIDHDVWKRRDHHLSRVVRRPLPPAKWEGWEALDGRKDGARDPLCRSFTVLANIEDDLFQVVCGSHCPNELHSLSREKPVDAGDDFIVLQQATRGDILIPALDGGTQVAFLQDKALEGMLSEVIDGNATLGCKVVEFLLKRRVEFDRHGSTLGL
jgi:hypothetical protein